MGGENPLCRFGTAKEGLLHTPTATPVPASCELQCVVPATIYVNRTQRLRELPPTSADGNRIPCYAEGTVKGCAQVGANRGGFRREPGRRPVVTSMDNPVSAAAAGLLRLVPGGLQRLVLLKYDSVYRRRNGFGEAHHDLPSGIRLDRLDLSHRARKAVQQTPRLLAWHGHDENVCLAEMLIFFSNELPSIVCAVSVKNLGTGVNANIGRYLLGDRTHTGDAYVAQLAKARQQRRRRDFSSGNGGRGAIPWVHDAAFPPEFDLTREGRSGHSEAGRSKVEAGTIVSAPARHPSPDTPTPIVHLDPQTAVVQRARR